MAETAIRVFYSYSRKDQALREKLDQHLAPLKHTKLIVTWHDLLLEPGSNWKQDIGNQLDTADIILLLVSANFLSSEYCYSIELRRALERDTRQEACVIPVILEPCDWKHDWIPFSKLTALPNHEKAITEWEKPETAFASVAKSIRGKVESLRQQRQVEEQKRLRLAEQLKQQQTAEAERINQEELERQRQEQLKQEAENNRQQEQAKQQLSNVLKGNYAQLKSLLKAGMWEEADQETGEQMCEVMGRQKERYLRVEDIEQFPCADLREIDRLWVKYSNGKFGFSVQKKIWQECGSPTEYNADWEKFGDRVGWYRADCPTSMGWLAYSDMIFDISAPVGQLPLYYLIGFWQGRGFFRCLFGAASGEVWLVAFSALSQQLIKCVQFVQSE